MVCVLWLCVLQSAAVDEPQWKPKIVVEHCGPEKLPIVKGRMVEELGHFLCFFV